MQTVAEMQFEIARLQALIKMQLDADNVESEAALKLIERSFEWQITLTGLAQYHIACRFDAATIAKLDEWRGRYPTSRHALRRDNDWHGMTYIIGMDSDGTPFIASTGGGSLILSTGSAFEGPFELTERQLADFVNGRVPLELMKPW